MNPGLVLLLTAVVLFLVVLLLRRPVGAYRRMRGTRVVTCPETRIPAAVNVNAALAARTALTGAEQLDLRSCSRWPERHDCGRECLKQIESNAEGCLVRTIVRNWYAGRKCAYCGRAFGVVPWVEHRPAVVLPGGAPVQWSKFRPEELDDVFSKYQPVCWDCFVAESVRSGHPELVTER